MSTTLDRETDRRETEDTTGMTHIAETRSRYLCGKERDPFRPLQPVFGSADCVVCEGIWGGMSFEQQRDLLDRLGS